MPRVPAVARILPATVVIAALSIAGLPAASGAAGADPAAAGGVVPTAPLSADSRPSTPPAGEYAVTLITGDHVLVTYEPGVKPRARVASEDPGGYEIRTEGDELYVIPASAEQALAAGLVDRRLFDVTGLVEQGYDDASVDHVPVIVTYGPLERRDRAAAPAGAETVASLNSINADVLQVDKEMSREVWRALSARVSRDGRGIGKIWLDAKVEATLDESVPFVGAPQAWDAGADGTGTTVAVLDSGIDAAHPDLAEAVIAAENFTTSPSVDDLHGHGTHVASTIAGSGASSGGSHSGVAPGAGLLVGKVLDDYGFGELSWIIAGMEWATAQGADVVNMSIGQDEPSDCSDPMAQAVDNLSASSDTVFVIAAGNLGGPAETVTSPGCAAAALTVGAVDLDASSAYFSSRGPVMTTHAVKPDITAPGVAITAARAGGRGDAAYRDMSGTSMAAPHVAGAAAIIRQLHPDWDRDRVKAALQSSVRPGSTAGIYEQGAGILDVANAVAHTVFGPSTVDLGTFPWPHTEDQATTVKVEYVNTGTAERRLTFAVDARGQTGAKLPAGAVSAGAGELIVPAGGSATLPLTVDPSAGLSYADLGAVGVRLVASADNGETVVTPVGAYIEPKHVDVTFRVIDRDGNVAGSGTILDVLDLDGAVVERVPVQGEEITLRLRAGTYSVASTVLAAPPGSFQPTSVAFLAEPEIELTEDRTMILDAREAKQVRVKTDRPAEFRSGSVAYARTENDWLHTYVRVYGDSVKAIYLGETGKARRGEFEVTETWVLASPEKTEAPYEYDLVYRHLGQVKGAPVHVATSENLAAVTSRYHTPGEADDYVEYFDAFRELTGDYVPVGDLSEVPAPGVRTHYLTADDDVRLKQTVVHPDGTLWIWGTRMASPTEAREPRSRREESWFRTGLRPGVPSSALLGKYDTAERTGDTIATSLSSWSDTEPGHYGWSGLTGPTTGVELFADGASLGRGAWFGDGFWTVPAGAHDYELVYDLHRFERDFSTWTAPNTARTTWRFRSATTAGPEALPLLFPDYDLDVDLSNRAPAEASYPVRIGVEPTPGYAMGEIASAEAWVSYDDGKSWTEVQVTRDGGELTALVDNRPALGGAVSLRVELTDGNGAGVEQEINRLYRVE